MIKNAKVPGKSQSSSSWQELSVTSRKAAVCSPCTWDCAGWEQNAAVRVRALCFLLCSVPHTLASGRAVGDLCTKPKSVSSASSSLALFACWPQTHQVLACQGAFEQTWYREGASGALESEAHVKWSDGGLRGLQAMKRMPRNSLVSHTLLDGVWKMRSCWRWTLQKMNLWRLTHLQLLQRCWDTRRVSQEYKSC